MKVMFIMPCVGKKAGEPYVKTWQMEPLAIAVLSALTPPDVEKVFYDDRLESIPYDEPTNLVAINVETYTARRAYQIGAEFRKRGVPVVMGGFHATLMPEETAEHADAVVIGAAEGLWEQVLEDVKNNNLGNIYEAGEDHDFKNILPDRSIYADKKYTDITLIETGRGCRFNCEFCSICRFFDNKYFPRPIKEVIREIKVTNKKIYFFIDDNIVVDKEHSKKLMKALIPLKIKWVGQVSIDISKDEEIVSLMRESGCIGVLIGFESLRTDNLMTMNKKVNTTIKDYEKALDVLRKYKMAVYATFLFGYDNDVEETFQQTLDFSLQQKFFFTAFNHLVPFPGTPLYDRLEKEKRLVFDKWWLNREYRFGDVAFKPKTFSPDELSDMCLKYREKFYSFPSIFKRGIDFKVNCASLLRFGIFWIQNFFSKKDVARRQGLPLGLREDV